MLAELLLVLLTLGDPVTDAVELCGGEGRVSQHTWGGERFSGCTAGCESGPRISSQPATASWWESTRNAASLEHPAHTRSTRTPWWRHPPQ
jgi:hypothetical protein